MDIFSGILKPLAAFGLLLALSSCSSWSPRPQEVVLTRAGYDFNCENSRIQLQEVSGGKFMARGCGMEGLYKVQCTLGPCHAKSVKK